MRLIYRVKQSQSISRERMVGFRAAKIEFRATGSHISILTDTRQRTIAVSRYCTRKHDPTILRILCVCAAMTVAYRTLL